MGDLHVYKYLFIMFCINIYINEIKFIKTFWTSHYFRYSNLRNEYLIGNELNSYTIPIKYCNEYFININPFQKNSSFSKHDSLLYFLYSHLKNIPARMHFKQIIFPINLPLQILVKTNNSRRLIQRSRRRCWRVIRPTAHAQIFLSYHFSVVVFSLSVNSNSPLISPVNVHFSGSLYITLQ